MIAPTNPIRYHSIIDVPLARPAGMSVPLLCIEGRDGSVWVSQSAYLYSRALQRRGFSVDKIQKCMRAIGLLSDFAQATAPLPRQVSQSGAQKLLEEFAEARLFGTISQDGSDPLGLYWKPVSFSTADYDCVLIAEFGEWLASHHSYRAGRTWESRFIGQILDSQRASKRLSHSMFLHLKNSVKGKAHKQSSSIWSFRRADRRLRSTGPSKTTPNSFPPAQIIPLIQASHSIRDQLLFLLLAYGGPRVSEALHLYVSDVIGVDHKGCAIVRLAHPEEARIQWSHGRHQRSGMRAEFLRERYGLVPRTRLGKTDPMRLGWKGMDLDREGHGYIQWLSAEAGQAFWRLHVEYMKLVRGIVPDSHPYYFVNISPDYFGSPLKLNNFNNQFYQTVRRIGLEPSDQGVNPHGLRHFYGYMLANVLKVAPEVAQEAFRHASLDSTMVYYRLTPSTVRASLEEAGQAASGLIMSTTGGSLSDLRPAL